MIKLKILLQSKYFIIVTLIFIFLYVLIFTKIIRYESNYDINKTVFEGVIIDYKIDGDKLSITLKCKEKIRVTYYFKNLEEKSEMLNQIMLGQTLIINGKLEEPQNNTIPNVFNYRQYLYNNKVYWLLNADSIKLKNDKIPFPYNIKNSFINRVRKYEKTSSYMYAFILGDNGYIDNNVYLSYQNNGVTHLFAVSGMHVSLFVVVLEMFLKKLKINENQRILGIVSFLLVYLFLVGFTASIIRASLFYVLLLFNRKRGWGYKSEILLYYLFLFLIIINPFYIYNIGFIYSFLTSLGLILFSKNINGNYFVKLFKTSFFAFLFSLPVTLYNFYEFNLLTIFNNIVVVPIISFVLFPLTILTFIFPFLENILSLGFNLLEIVNLFLDSISIMIPIGKISFIFILIYYLLIYLGLHYKVKFLTLIIVLFLINKIISILDSNSYLYFLDVGQGDATLIITPFKQDIILIDSGGKIEYEKENWQIRNSNFNLADSLVQFLHSLGIGKIDLFIGTHGDIDHIGYANDIFKKIEVDNIMLNNNKYNNQEQELLKLGNRVNDYYYGKQVILQNLNNLVGDDENDSSLVIFANIKNNNILLMGDAPKKVELNILEKYKISVDLLKVGHHGSKTSTDIKFLEYIKPKYAIISSGRNNRYNHPAMETLNNLKKVNVEYFDTQDKGTICFIMKKESEKLKFYTP